MQARRASGRSSVRWVSRARAAAPVSSQLQASFKPSGCEPLSQLPAAGSSLGGLGGGLLLGGLQTETEVVTDKGG